MVTEARYRPYASPANVIDLLHRFRTRNLPEVIDTDYIRAAGVSEGAVARALMALRFLRLVADSDEPTDELRSLARSTDEEYRDLLAGVVRGAYRDVFDVVDPAQDTQDAVINAFRRFEPASQHYRMAVLFLGLCREAGIAVMDETRHRQSRSAGAARSATRASSRRASTTGAQASTPRIQVPAETAVAQGSAVLWGYFRRLPRPGSPFPESEQRAWLDGMKAAFALEYPQEAERPKDEEPRMQSAEVAWQEQEESGQAC